MKTDSHNDKKVLGVSALVAINMCIIFSVRGFPLLAEEGLSLVFYLLFSALTFLVPTALICAELSSAWPPRGPGGVYIWTREAFGTKWAFLAVWFQWISAVVWFPTVLSFIAATIAYIFDPSLANNKLFILLVVLGIYWLATFANLMGMKEISWISTFGILSSFFITALFIFLGALWIFQGRPIEITFTLNSFMPNLESLDNLAFLAGVMVIISGIEIAAVHTDAVKNPKRSMPLAILICTVLSCTLLLLGSLALAIVVPQKDISLVAGLMEAFEFFLKAYHLHWMSPIIALLIVSGSVGEVTSWILGPSKGFLVSAKDGVLPPFFQKLNRNEIPVNILVAQALIVTALMCVFVLMPSINSAYWILTALNAQLYLIMYIMMFIGVVVLRHKKPHVPRNFKIGGGMIGIYFVAMVAILGGVFTLILGFFPPSQLETGNIWFYELFLMVGILSMTIVPLLIYALRKPHWERPY
ncbi:MAG: hypothetical protein B6240_00530 [Desulfobacteraceae bacterium 4572_87]|nr:MAG: hypothetical protein B6240_00530 [Desulfobacteraceae bacterium 4572_87]